MSQASNRFLNKDNVTLAIDLRDSWTNASLSIGTIVKGAAPVFSWPGFFHISGEEAFYLWSGEHSQNSRTFGGPLNALWKFSSDGNGSGAWSQDPFNNMSQISPQSAGMPIRPGEGGCSITLGDTGYHVGGQVWPESDPGINDGVFGFKDTISSFNTTTSSWGKNLKTLIGTTGAIMGASAVSVPATGLENRSLIVLIGGREPGPEANTPAYQNRYYGLDNVTIYDPTINKWFAQRATGDIPNFREDACAVATRGNNNNYEM